MSLNLSLCQYVTSFHGPAFVRPAFHGLEGSLRSSRPAMNVRECSGGCKKLPTRSLPCDYHRPLQSWPEATTSEELSFGSAQGTHGVVLVCGEACGRLVAWCRTHGCEVSSAVSACLHQAAAHLPLAPGDRHSQSPKQSSRPWLLHNAPGLFNQSSATLGVWHSALSVLCRASGLGIMSATIDLRTGCRTVTSDIEIPYQ